MPKKNLTAADKRYRQYLRTLPCYACGLEDETVVGHHLTYVRSIMGGKAGEENQVPMDFTCHIERLHRHGERSFWKGLGFNLEEVKQYANSLHRSYHDR